MKKLLTIVLAVSLIAVYLPVPKARAAITCGSGVSAFGSASTLTTAATSNTTGNLLFVAIRDNQVSNSYTVADTALNTYTQIGSNINNTLAGQDVFAIFYAKNITGNASNQVTVTAGFSFSFGAISVLECSGLDTTSPLDASGSAITASASSLTSSTFTTAAANEVIIAGASVAALSGAYTAGAMGGVTGTIPSGVTQQGELITIEYAVVSSIVTNGTAAISWNGGAGRAEMGVATFQAASDGGATPTPHAQVIINGKEVIIGSQVIIN